MAGLKAWKLEDEMALELGVNHDLGDTEALRKGGDVLRLTVENAASLRSIAISLKRIADALEPNLVTEAGALNVREAAKMAGEREDVDLWKITTETIVRRVRIAAWRNGVRARAPR